MSLVIPTQAGADVVDLEPEGDPRPMTMLAEIIDVVVGVDTHRDTHTAHLVNPIGAMLGELTVPNSTAGFNQLLAWIAGLQPGPRIVLAVEGTRSYGIALARHAAAAGLHVVEVEQPKRAQRRRRGKSDPIDARLAALAVLQLPTHKLATPRADGDREALRILLTSRDQLTSLKTVQANQLHALLLAGDDEDRQLSRGTFNQATLGRIARRRPGRDADLGQAVHRAECRRLAIAVRDLERQLAANKKQLAGIVEQVAPGITTRPGIGPVSAATAIVAFSHPGRLRSEAAFAAMAGTCPIPAGSGQTQRERLNRGGDRTLNRAIHTIARNRLINDEQTRAYAQRRRTEGKSDREIIRCLKRYISRQLYRQLTSTMATA
jgi:transposase